MQGSKGEPLVSKSHDKGSSSDDCHSINSDLSSQQAILTDYDMNMTMGDHGHPLGMDGVEPPALPNRKQLYGIGVFVLMSVAMIAIGLVVAVSSEKKGSTLASEQARLEESIRGRSQYVQTWIDSRLLTGRRLTESSLVKLYIGDMALHPADHPLPRSLLDQRPYFQTLMTDFARQNDLLRAAIIDRNGRLLLGSSGPPLKIEDLLAQVAQASAGWNAIISPIRTIESGEVVVDILAPIPKAQSTNIKPGEDTALLIQTFPIEGMIKNLLTIPVHRKNAENLFLIQNEVDSPRIFRLSEDDSSVVTNLVGKDFLPVQKSNFGRWSVFGDQSEYSMSSTVTGTDWIVVHSVDARAILAPVNNFIFATTLVATLTVLIAIFGFSSFFWRRTNAHHHELFSLYRSLATRLNKQRQFLMTVTNSISDWLVVSGPDNRCIFANPAIVSALELNDKDVLGRNINEILPLRPTSASDNTFDQFSDAEEVSILEAGKQSYCVTNSSSDLRDHHGEATGTVNVLRDQTELVEQRQRHLRSLTGTIEAFIHAVERRDPFLLGHTDRLRRYSLAVGRRLELDNDALAALALAASLSQIGKIFIPDEILAKPERHIQQETEIMRSHIDHTLSILRSIDFGFPVVGILKQMHERLDGSGYPLGLESNDIDLPGRILGAVDVFCARTAPRSYRDRISAGNALYHLAENVGRYDIRVTAELAEVVAQEGSVDPISESEAGFLDAQFWEQLRQRSGSEQTIAA
ncbi:MAG: HD domain-containing phosphohydrolase [Geminicoccales bacterium]